MSASSLLTARITRLESAGADSFLLDWDAPGDGTIIDACLHAVRKLPWQQRTYLPAARAWLVHRSGIAWLAARWPALAEAFDALEAARHLSGEVPADVALAFARLHLLPTAPVDVVQAVYRTLAKHVHPDTAGEHLDMIAINGAYEVARAWAEQCAR